MNSTGQRSVGKFDIMVVEVKDASGVILYTASYHTPSVHTVRSATWGSVSQGTC